MKKFKIGGQFSGVGAFDQALIRLGVDYENVYQADWDKYARQTYLHNYEEPEYYVKDVYDTPTHDITEKHGSLDIMMFSPPCQSFSLAGKRKGEDDDRGILFYNSHEFIKINKPRYFIFENVKGLLSDAGGKTFGRWIEYLGGKSVNGTANMFPSENSVPYHIYYRVLNAKNYNIPQNRERVFIIGIRDDEDNNFSWPKEEVLGRRLRDIIETFDKSDFSSHLEFENYIKKYCLSERMIQGFVNKKTNGFNGRFKPLSINDKYANCITTNAGSRITDNFISIGYINQDTQASQVYSVDGLAPSFCAGTHGYANGYVSVKSATKQGYEIAEIGEDSINFEHPDSKTRRGRVGVGVLQTLTTSCNQGVHDGDRIRKFTPRECFRGMDFPDTFSWPVSDSQAYKQAGNSICVGVLERILKNILHLQ